MSHRDPAASTAQWVARMQRLLIGRQYDRPSVTLEIALRELGWATEHDLRIDYYWDASDSARTRAVAKQVIETRPDLIVTVSTPATQALRDEASEIIPLEYEMRDAEEAGRVIGRKILIVKAAGEAEFNAAFATIIQAGAGALLVRGGPVFLNRRRLLVTLANRHALPASYVTRDYPEAGGLMSYGPSQTDAYRRAGIYAARILKGAKPGDLPVDQATRFDLVINLATAKALGLEVPATLLARADEVIE